MGTVRPVSQVKLFCGLLLAPNMAQPEVEETLQQAFGPIVLRSTPFPFTETTYYRREMGAALTRLYVAFEPLIDMAALAATKHTTNRLETMWAEQAEHRRVNLDPGYLDLAKVVLASTKDHAHRLYIGAGMFAEITLRYQDKRFQPWDWTYRDYRLPEALSFFSALREMYKAQLRQGV